MSGYGGGAKGGMPSVPAVQTGQTGSSGSTGCGVALLIGLGVLALIVFGVLSDQGAFSESGPDFEDGVFMSADATRLSQRLDAAAKIQGVCYGWEIDTDRSFQRPAAVPTIGSPMPGTTASPVPLPVPTRSGVDLGSNLGAGVDVRSASETCPKWVIFTATYDWDIIEEVQTLRSFGVESSFSQGPTTADLHAAGITEDALKKQDAAARLADAVGALPMIVSEKGVASPAPAPPSAAPVPGDTVQPNGFPISLLVGGLMIAGGLVWIVIGVVRSRRRSRPNSHPNNQEAFPNVR